MHKSSFLHWLNFFNLLTFLIAFFSNLFFHQLKLLFFTITVNSNPYIWLVTFFFLFIIFSKFFLSIFFIFLLLYIGYY